MEEIQLSLTKLQSMKIRKLCEKERRKRVKLVNASNYIPEPGKRNSDEVRAEACEEIIHMIDVASEEQ